MKIRVVLGNEYRQLILLRSYCTLASSKADKSDVLSNRTRHRLL